METWFLQLVPFQRLDYQAPAEYEAAWHASQPPVDLISPPGWRKAWQNGKLGALPRYRSMLAGINCVLSGPFGHAHQFSGVVPAG